MTSGPRPPWGSGHSFLFVFPGCLASGRSAFICNRKELGGEAQVCCLGLGRGLAQLRPGASGAAATSWAEGTSRRSVAPAQGRAAHGWLTSHQSPVLPLALSQFLFLTLPPTSFPPEVLSVLGMGCPLLGQL